MEFRVGTTQKPCACKQCASAQPTKPTPPTLEETQRILGELTPANVAPPDLGQAIRAARRS